MKKLTGTCACPGEVIGKVKFYSKDKIFSKEDVVILNEYITQNIIKLKEVSAILSSEGGITCHASIIARELGIPCLISVRDLEQLKEGDLVKIDAAAEEVTLL